jgi:hypothetical protein
MSRAFFMGLHEINCSKSVTFLGSYSIRRTEKV